MTPDVLKGVNTENASIVRSLFTDHPLGDSLMRPPIYLIYNREIALFYKALGDHEFQDWLAQHSLLQRDPSKVEAGRKLVDDMRVSKVRQLTEFLLDESRADYMVPDTEAIRAVYEEDYHYKLNFLPEDVLRFARNTKRIKIRRDKLRAVMHTGAKGANEIPFYYKNNALSLVVDYFPLSPLETVILNILYKQPRTDPQRPIKESNVMRYIRGVSSYSEEELAQDAHTLVYQLRIKVRKNHSDLEIVTVPKRGLLLS